MLGTALIAAGVVVGVGAVAASIWRPIRAARRDAMFARAGQQFHLQRERLEAKFLQLAAASGKPRGLRWADCEFEDSVEYARNRSTGELSAFVGVTIAFEAIEGGGMEDVEAVGNLRAATAVFQYERGNWVTQGRAMFNLNPTQAIAFYQGLVEPMGERAARRAV